MGLAYDVHAYTTHVSDTGSFVVYAATGQAGANRCLEAMAAEINRLQQRRVGEAELARVKQSYRGRLWLSLEDTHAVASWFGFQEILDQPGLTPEASIAEIDAVAAGDVLRVARTYLDPERSTLAAVGEVEHLNTTILGFGSDRATDGADQ
jgi:predicted Zn-dependent peptidase